jgi:micrococcal nuclease
VLKLSTLTAGLAVVMMATAAHADPCTAPVTGYAPGAKVSGLVVYVGDGDGLCVALGPSPNQWVEIRLADFYAPELSAPGGKVAKAHLDSLVFGVPVVCTAVSGGGGRTYSYDRLLARCTVDGKDLGDLMRAAGVVEGGRGR